MIKRFLVLPALAALLIGGTAFAQGELHKGQGGAPDTVREMHTIHMKMPPMAPPITTAVCVLYPTTGNSAHGVVVFTQTEQGVRIVANVEGLTPGDHGFHIHVYGDMRKPDGTSEGGHFNPFHKQHGAPMAAEHHLGDLGNITADAQGKAHYDWTDPELKLNGPNSIVGRGIIVHQGKDDLTTQPTGNAGARVAFGVIGAAQ